VTERNDDRVSPTVPSDGVPSDDRPPAETDAPQYGVGPFSVRELVLLGLWAVAFLVSFFPTNTLGMPSRVLIGGENVWLSGLWWIPAIALPTVAVGLLVLRRLSPDGIRRVGSLGIDQFAAVAFSVAALVWVAWVWDTVAIAAENGVWVRSWVIWVEAVVLLAGVVLTVFAPFIPPFEQDFQGRREVPAHRNARPIRPVVARPRADRSSANAEEAARAGADGTPDADGPTPGSYTGSTDLPHDAVPATATLPRADDRTFDDRAFDDRGAAESGVDRSAVDRTQSHDTDVFAPLHAGDEQDRHADDRVENAHGSTQAFWALVPEERDIVDDYGTPIFRVTPMAWALVIEDRGETFVIRHDDGRIGYLHDVGGITRG